MHKSDTDAIRAADQAFYTALSGRDIQAMARVWADKPYVICIGPRSKVMNVGLDSVKKYWEWAFDFFSKMSVSKSDAQIQTDGKLAWVVGVEHAEFQLKSGGERVKFDTFSTHVLEKVDGRWLLVSHHAQMIPKESPF
jgi:ketosteroid isomerase-like protein